MKKSLKLAPNRWFSLPRVGTSAFSELMKARVKYDPKLGFKITSETDIPRALSTLSTALSQTVEIESACFICDKDLGHKEPPGTIICSDCENADDAFELYKMKFSSFMSDI